MELTQTWQGAETARAFDGVAGEYHRSNVENPILAHMRERVMAAVRMHVARGSRVLDLGCGPGTDHPALTAIGYQVTGIDSSPHMIREATRRAAQITHGRKPEVICQPIQHLGELRLQPFDAVLSNFGPLNCVPDLDDVATQIRDALKPGGLCIASVIGRVCPWEIALYLSRLESRRAFIRFRSETVGVPLKDGLVWMRYLTPGEFTGPFRACGFELVSQHALGVVAPPPYMTGFAERHPQLLYRLLAWDKAVSAWPVARHMGDHSLLVLRRA